MKNTTKVSLTKNHNKGGEPFLFVFRGSQEKNETLIRSLVFLYRP